MFANVPIFSTVIKERIDDLLDNALLTANVMNERSSSPESPWISRHTGILIAAITTFAFNRSSKYLEQSRATQPQSTKNNEYLSWKWRNFLISLVHSIITGLSTIYCFYDEPQLAKDMINTESKPAYLLACFSNGYFVYDLIEMIIKFGYKGAGELIGHHLLVISCLSISVWQNRYLGYSCAALVVELNNIFLHSRQLLNIAKVSKRSIIYRLNCWTNIASFLVFRMFTLVWLGKCLYDHRHIVPLIPYSTALVCLVVVSVMTCVLLYRLIYSDFIAIKHNSGTFSSSSTSEVPLLIQHEQDMVRICSNNSNANTAVSSNGHSHQTLTNCNMLYDKLR